MGTLNQQLKKKKLKNQKKFNALEKNPQKKGICLKVYTINPKKPNSANRRIAKVQLINHKTVIGYIPGENSNIQEHSMVLVRGGKVKDLPGVKYHLIRGVYDLEGVSYRKSARSKYGVKKQSG